MMAHETEQGISKPCNGLSFIDWDELSEEEYVKLDKIINSPSASSGVQFPFLPEAERAAGQVSSVEVSHLHDAPVFQPAIPPPAMVRYPIPPYHWTQGDPAMAPPPGAHYPITVQGGYVYPGPALSASGEATVAFVPAMSSTTPMYAITGVPGHHIPPSYQTVPMPQSEPVDLSVSVSRPPGGAETLSQVPPGTAMHANPPTQAMVISQGPPGETSVTLAISNGDSSVTMSQPGVPHPHPTQIVYISQSNIVPAPSSVSASQTIATDIGTDNNFPTSQSPAISGLPPVQQSSSIEFGGPVVFSKEETDSGKELRHTKDSVSSNNKNVNREVVIDMEDLNFSDTPISPREEVTNSHVRNEPGLSSQSLQTSTENSQMSREFANGSNVSSHSTNELNNKVQSAPVQNDNTINSEASPLPVASAPPPVKMWSSLFGSNKSNTGMNNAPTAARPAVATSGAVPNAVITEEVKSVRYWQEQDKNEAKQQNIVPTEKVTPVGVQNDPLAAKILEQLLKLPITHTPIVIQPRGLVNGSNICFMNATLQVLMGCPPFIHMFRAFKNLGARPGSYSSTPIFDSLVQFVNSFQNGQRIRNQGSRNKKGPHTDISLGQPFSPAPLLSVAQNILGLHIGVQHDAEEFLSQILMICHEELENVMKLNHSDGLNNNDKEQNRNGYAQDIDYGVDDEAEDETWQKVGPKNHHVETNVNDCGQTPLSSIFAGLSRSCLIRESGKTSDTVDSFFTLKLDIQGDNVHSVKDALLRLNSVETVHDADGGKIQGQRRTFFDVLPPVLILHLKLFQYSNGNGQKIQKKINFDVDLMIPKETLSRVGKTKLASPKSRTYKLFGVVNHHGMKMNDGHYTSDVYLPAASGWLRFDDSEVMAIQELQVLQYSERRMPYLLFYRRMDVS